MGYKMTFKRYEAKFLLTKQQKEELLKIMKPYMQPDEYGRTTIRNIYLDTENFRMIRRSLEKPVYKEKLRIRSYRPVTADDTVFVELKKKYNSVVYKRRLALTDSQASAAFELGTPLPSLSQIADEIEYVRQFYGCLRPAVFLSYEREAFRDKAGSDFRVTFDENILYRTESLSLGSAAYGTAILDDGQTVMEIKTAGGTPLWMAGALGKLGIRKTSFSKYGTAYTRMMRLDGDNRQRSFGYA